MDVHPQLGGFVIWITGMNGAGKSALAAHLHRRFVAAGRRVELVDADDPTEILTRDLGTAAEDRDAAVRRVGHVARLLARNGVVALVAALSPHREPREALRREVRRFVEVFLDCPMETLLKRDKKYALAMARELTNVPGVDAPYEPPTHAEVRVNSATETVEQEAMRVLQALVDLKLIGPAEYGKLTGGQRPRRGRPPARKAGKRSSARRAPKKPARSGRKARR